jgi:hypothetical protein
MPPDLSYYVIWSCGFAQGALLTFAARLLGPSVRYNLHVYGVPTRLHTH